MLAALKVPKAFIGYEEGVEGKATLAQEDIKKAVQIHWCFFSMSPNFSFEVDARMQFLV